MKASLRASHDEQDGWSEQDLLDGFELTGRFLLRHVLEPRGQGHSAARAGFINAVVRKRTAAVADGARPMAESSPPSP